MKVRYNDIIQQAYEAFNKRDEAFNKRDIDAVLSLMTEDVHWPNGWEGGYVKGHDEVRDYWTRQWKELNPTVLPVSILEANNATIVVEVHQIVKDTNGNLLLDGILYHLYQFDNRKIKSMEIKPAD